MDDNDLRSRKAKVILCLLEKGPKTIKQLCSMLPALRSQQGTHQACTLLEQLGIVKIDRWDTNIYASTGDFIIQEINPQ